MSFWAVGITAAVSVGTTVYAANQNKKAAEQQAAAYGGLGNGSQFTSMIGSYEGSGGGGSIDVRSGLREGFGQYEVNVDPYQAVDVNAVRNEATSYNANEGAMQAGTAAYQLNDRAVTDVEYAMSRMFGGGDNLQQQRDASNEAIQSWLTGQVSQSTRQQLSRQALATGATELGSGAVGDLYGGYLGITREEIMTQGVEAYRSLYDTYRQAVPIVSGSDVMEYTTLSASDAVQSNLYNSLNASNASLSEAQLRYQAAQGGDQMQLAIAELEVQQQTAANALAAEEAGLAAQLDMQYAQLGYNAQYNQAGAAAGVAGQRARNNAAIAGAVGGAVGSIAGATRTQQS